MSVHDVVGTIGVTAIVSAYLLLQLGRLHAASRAYSAINALGAGLVLWSLVFDFNLAAFLVEAFWLAISIFGFTRGMRVRRSRAGIRKGTPD